MTKIIDSSDYPKIYRYAGSQLPVVPGLYDWGDQYEVRPAYGILAPGGSPRFFASDSSDDTTLAALWSCRFWDCDSHLIRDEDHLIRLGFVCTASGATV